MSGPDRTSRAGTYPHLSPNDIAAVQRYYGSPQPAQGLAGALGPEYSYEVFARGTNVGNVWRTGYPGGWKRFSSVPSSGSSAVSSWGLGRLDVFFRATVAKKWGEPFTSTDAAKDGRIIHHSVDTWGGSKHPMNNTDWMGSPVAVSPAAGKVEFFGRSGEFGSSGVSTSYARPMRTFYNNGWTQDQLLGDPTDKATGDVAVVKINSDQISVFWRFKPTDAQFPPHPDLNRLIMQTVTVGSTQVEPRFATHAVIASAPSAIQARPGQSEVFVRGPKGGVYHLSCNAHVCWGGPVYAIGGKITGNPSAVSRGGMRSRSDIWVFGRSPGAICG